MAAVDYLNESVKELIGGKTAAALQKSFNIFTVGDLLHHYPRRYAERGQLTPFDQIEVGKPVTIMATIATVTVRRMKTKRGVVLVVSVTDGKDFMELTFFNQKWREKELVVGRSGLFAGTVSEFQGVRTLTHPQYQLFASDQSSDLAAINDFAGSIIPVYPSSQAITSWQIASSVDLVLASLDELPDPIPEFLRKKHELMGRAEAIRAIHQPSSRSDIARAQTRLKYQEAFVLQAILEEKRRERRGLTAVSRETSTHNLRKIFDSALPFDLTSGQIDAGLHIEQDLAGDSPMLRLLQGDVGSGKTIVAIRAMLDVVEAGGQAALLAPTEVLAAQHFESLSALLGDLCSQDSVHLTLLTGSMSAPARKQALLDIASGTTNIVIGTHALIQERVDFFDLGLAVIDEQHRFGVEQRAALVAKGREGAHPHLLIMTATPIPRTTALTIFGDLDISTISEAPSMRAHVETFIVKPQENPRHEARVWERMREEVEAGNRVFVVCARISSDASAMESDFELMVNSSVLGESEELEGVASVEDTLMDLSQRFPHIHFAGLHGKMSSEEKREVMASFRGVESNPVQVLVATTVIEVGVDIPAATMMIINNAERFGISQLHQLRGRIGRGERPGLCILMQGPGASLMAEQRLAAVASTRDGFVLAQLDLDIRREGNVLGSEQSGAASSLRLLRVVEDVAIIESVREEIVEISMTEDWTHIVSSIEEAEYSRVAQLEKM